MAVLNRNLKPETGNLKGNQMFHLSRAIVFIACLAAAVFVSWQTGLIGLIVALFFVPREVVRHRIIKPAAGDK